MINPSTAAAAERRPAVEPFSVVVDTGASPVPEPPHDAAPAPLERAEDPAHLLVVDDDIDGLELIITHLRDYDLAVSTAQCGREALAIAGEVRPDLILLDLSLPGLDGFAVLGRLKQSPATASIPVIVLTSHRDIEHKVRCFELNAADYLVKPVAEAELHARVTAQLRQVHLRHALSRRLRTYEQRFGPLDEAVPAAAADSTTHADVAMLLHARQILRERLADPPSLTELARLVGTNQPRLSKSFLALFGTTAYGFVRETRLRRARELLAGTQLPVKTIALQIGYRGSSDLTRAIKSRYGVTPTVLRERLQALPQH
jgi:DNA-binding response OmpR family regulator